MRPSSLAGASTESRFSENALDLEFILGLNRCQQVFLIAFDREMIVRTLSLQTLGRFFLGVHCIGADGASANVSLLKRRNEELDFIRLFLLLAARDRQRFYFAVK